MTHKQKLKNLKPYCSKFHLKKSLSFNATFFLQVIECLYKAVDSDGRILGPVLRPYLNQIFKGSHENCWFLPEWKKKTDMSEFEAIGAFSSLVISENIDPLEGILDSANKGWNWAKNCLHILQSITVSTKNLI